MYWFCFHLTSGFYIYTVKEHWRWGWSRKRKYHCFRRLYCWPVQTLIPWSSIIFKRKNMHLFRLEIRLGLLKTKLIIIVLSLSLIVSREWWWLPSKISPSSCQPPLTDLYVQMVRIRSVSWKNPGYFNFGKPLEDVSVYIAKCEFKII